jgi:uncharacterized coiled-coil protein SlyX
MFRSNHRRLKEILDMGALTEAAITALTTQVAANNSYIASLESQITTLEGQLTASDTDESDAAAINAQVALLATADTAPTTAPAPAEVPSTPAPTTTVPATNALV